MTIGAQILDLFHRLWRQENKRSYQEFAIEFIAYVLWMFDEPRRVIIANAAIAKASTLVSEDKGGHNATL